MCMDPTLWATAWSDDGAGNSLKAKPMCTTKNVVADRPWWCQNWWKVCGKQFAEPALHNFETLWSIPPDLSITAARNRLPVAWFSESVCKMGAKAADRWTQNQTSGRSTDIPPAVWRGRCEFLDNVVTGDETWVSHATTGTKQLSIHWRHIGSPVNTKIKQTIAVKKRHMLCLLGSTWRPHVHVFTTRGDHKYCSALSEIVKSEKGNPEKETWNADKRHYAFARQCMIPYSARHTESVASVRMGDLRPSTPQSLPCDKWLSYLMSHEALPGRKTFPQQRDGEVQTAVNSWLQALAVDS